VSSPANSTVAGLAEAGPNTILNRGPRPRLQPERTPTCSSTESRCVSSPANSTVAGLAEAGPKTILNRGPRPRLQPERTPTCSSTESRCVSSPANSTVAGLAEAGPKTIPPAPEPGSATQATIRAQAASAIHVQRLGCAPAGPRDILVVRAGGKPALTMKLSRLKTWT
jgi:hypothetical protein